MKKFISFLKATRIFDGDSTLSLTSLMMFVIIFKVAVAPSLDFELVVTFFLALASYNTKKVLRQKEQAKSVGDTEKLTQLETAVQAIKTSMALRK